jgi:hypothetical protein
MELFTLLSKKEQVAEAIKKQIVSGKTAPGTKLSSVRELAESFSVSTKIMIDAFDILEAEKFIHREPGRGIFVRGRSPEDVIDVCLLGYRMSQGRDAYFSDLAKIAYPPFLHNGFSFTVRIVPPVDAFDDERFVHELTKIERHLYADCLLISAPSLNKKQISACIKLKTPVIFIGAFSSGLYPDMPFNQIMDDNVAMGYDSVRQLKIATGCRKLTLYTGSVEHYFYRKFYEGVLKAGNELDIQINLVEIPKGASKFSIEKQLECYIERILHAKQEGWLNDPGIDSGISHDRLREAFTACNCNQTVYCVDTSDASYVNFFDIIYERIRAVVNCPDEYKKIKFNPAIKLYLSSNLIKQEER